MEALLQWIALEVLAILAQLALVRLVSWLRTRFAEPAGVGPGG
jgi:hypothetical protein